MYAAINTNKNQEQQQQQNPRIYILNLLKEKTFCRYIKNILNPIRAHRKARN